MLGDEKGLLGDESQSVYVGQVRLAFSRQCGTNVLVAQMSHGKNVRRDKCQVGQMSCGKNVRWDKCQVGQMSHFIIGGTNVTFYI
jgi:hypothetical protein